MGLAMILLASAVGAATVSTDAVAWFPGDYFDSRVRKALHREVMNSWPGPSELLRRWRSGDLDEDARVSLLVGGAAFHDPLLLPAYLEAVTSPSQRVRQAAVYGYRDLMADSLPDVRAGIDDHSAALLGEEMDWVSRTLRRRSLLELWLQSVLAHEGKSLPGWFGVTLERPVGDCFAAIEKLVGVEDLDLLVTTYRLSEDLGTRISLIKLVEAVSLSRFIVLPEGGRKGWGSQVFKTAENALDAALGRWSTDGCFVDGERVVRGNLATMGVTVADPLSAEACLLWINVLERGYPQWWMLASRRLYACGGPWLELSALDPDSEQNRAMRLEILRWFQPLKADLAPPPAAR
jgi:hypothetical protein